MEDKKQPNRKKKIVIIIILIVALFIGVIIFAASHSTYILYNDWFVIGSTFDEVEERYGEFDYDNGGNLKGYYLYTDNSWIMPDHLPRYYFMRCDENGIITDVYVQIPPGG